MQNLGLILATLYPNAVPLVDYRVQDDGSGPHIAHWDEAKLGKQPTGAELLAAEEAALTKIAAKREIARLEASVTQRRLREALRGPGKAWLDGVDDLIAAERAKL